jgi:thioredoxin reductase (NADPH)
MYDTAIIGLGCAGYTTAIYSARYKLKTLIVGAQEGGMGMSAADVGNWPGDIEVRGPDLMERFKNHATSFSDVEMKLSKVEKIEKALSSTELCCLSTFAYGESSRKAQRVERHCF